MGFLRKLFGRRPDIATVLEDAIERLQIGIATDLIADYTTRLKLQPPKDAVELASCVLTYATAMNPIGQSAQRYEETHVDLVRTEALRLVELPQVAEAFSYLYAAITILLAIRTGALVSKLSEQLGARATELALYIPNTYDICGSGDAVKCVQAITTFAVNYHQRALTP